MRQAFIWAGWNLVFSNFIIPLLSENILRFALGMWMPALSAIIFLCLEKKNLKSGLNWAVGSLKSYPLAIFIPVTVAAITVSIGYSFGKLIFNSDHTVQVLGAIATLAIWIVSSLGEEIGWRGYLHNHLRKLRHAPLLIGCIWGAWHYQQLLKSGASILMIANFTVLTILASYFLCWLIESGGSVFACGFFHGVWNFLRLKILFGNPTHGTTGFFLSSEPQFTEMEGFYGVIALSVVICPFAVFWYKNHRNFAVH